MMKKIAVLLVALTMAAGGCFLALYAAADDAPGAVLMGIVVVAGAVWFGVMGLQRTAANQVN